VRKALEEGAGEAGSLVGCEGRLEGENLHFPDVFKEAIFFFPPII